MCGRFAQIDPIAAIKKIFLVDEVQSNAPPRYNISPGNNISAVVMKDNKRVLVDFKWGLVPHWSKDPLIGQKLINARAETVSEKPSFKSALSKRRCLIIASGFYEWRKEGSAKVPVYVHLCSGNVFAFAGLYERWVSAQGQELNTCIIITTDSNELLAPVHNRMPVIVPQDKQSLWLDISSPLPEVLSLLKPYPSDEMKWHEVSKMINAPDNNSPECIEAV